MQNYQEKKFMKTITNMNKFTFNDYLQEIHMEDYHGTDDDSVDAYETWLSDLQVDEIMAYAQTYAGKYAVYELEQATKELTTENSPATLDEVKKYLIAKNF